MSSSVTMVNLDFDAYKAQLKAYLKSQARFKDYDFDGSNMAVLLDILAYNTYQNAFYLNMIGSEMFLDTSVLRDSAVSHAKELNYVPRSFRSAEAVVDIRITSANTDKISATMAKGTSFTARFGSNNYTFTTDENIVINGSGGVLQANNISLYQGRYIVDTYAVDYNNLPRYVLTNKTVDTRSMTVTVIEDGGANILAYRAAESLFGLNKNSQVYFIQAAEDYGYEIVFGDGVIGRKPKDNSIVMIEYRICSGELPNGLRRFVADGPIDGEANVAITTVLPASGGSVAESLESIKFNAPRYYTSQERAITTEDYETLLRVQFPEINAVSAYGGEDVDPPQYGRVFVAIDITGADGLPDSKRSAYKTFLKNRSPLSIEPVIVEPDYLYIAVTGVARYNITQTTLTPRDIELLVISKILEYNQVNLNNFNATLRYSQLVREVDDAHPSMVSNNIDVFGMKKIRPKKNVSQSIDIAFDFPLYNKLPQVPLTHPATDEHVITSTQFILENQPCVLEDDGDGIIRAVSIVSSNHTTIRNIGTVNYDTGLVQLTNFKITDFTGDGIRIYARPRTKDLSSSPKTLVSILENEINIGVEQVRE